MLDENELTGSDPYIQRISDILEKCKPYTCSDFNSETEAFTSDLGGMIFQNVDGNRTNFDSFSMELERLNFKFQIIGLAETNIGVEDSSVYQLDGYKPFYQDKHASKSKGTGVALYISNKLNAVVKEELSWVTKNLETLFVTIQHKEPLHVCVLYRPPSGDSSEAITEFKRIIEMCPKKNVYFLGDFNINLHDEFSKIVHDFENTTLGLGLSPLISTYTHERPGCKKTCIDNILTNSIESAVLSGSISTFYSIFSTHHFLQISRLLRNISNSMITVAQMSRNLLKNLRMNCQLNHQRISQNFSVFLMTS